MKIQVIQVCFGVLFSSMLWANTCNENNDGLIASYEMETFIDSQSKKDRAVKTVSFEFIRKNHNLVVYQYPDMGISKSWYRSKNERISTVHYFDEFKRAIEYDNGDLSKDISRDWGGMYPMISQTFLDSMDSKEKTDNCELTFNHKQGNQNWMIVWSESLDLPIEMMHTIGNRKTVLKLNAFKHDETLANATLSKLNAYQGTDYADIGDNESDPFLRKMIRLGFVKHGASGFYDANGHALESAHSEHGH